MPRFSTAFPSKYLRAADLDGDDLVVTIKAVEFEEFKDKAGNPEERPVVYFREIKKGLPLNKTNGQRLADKYGDEMEDWVDVKVKLYEEEVTFDGKRMPTIRVKVSSAKSDVAKPRRADDDDERKPTKKYVDKGIEEDEVPF
jgi:hypothetical protein